VIALRCVVMMAKCFAPSINRKPIRRQLASTTAMATLQPRSLALATPAAIIFRLASSVSRWVGTKSGMGLLYLVIAGLDPAIHPFEDGCAGQARA
jgi:hypothetical protein